VEAGGLAFDSLAPYGSGNFVRAGVRMGLRADTRDSHSLPTSGLTAELTARAFPSVLDVEDTFGGVYAELGGVLSAPVVGDPALSLRLTGERVWGVAPFQELAGLGGSSTLPGYVRRRFLGHTATSGSGLFRLKLLEPHVLTDLHLGAHGLATAGRVWSHVPETETWHTAFGGGLWIHIPSIDRTVSFTAVQGDTGPRLYLDFGLIF
jgi:hypothetical protein